MGWSKRRRDELAKVCNHVFFILTVAFWLASCSTGRDGQDADGETKIDGCRSTEYGFCADSLTMERFNIEKGDFLGSILSRIGLDAARSEQVIEALAPFYDPSKLKPGNCYEVYYRQDTVSVPSYIVLEKSLVDHAVVDLTGTDAVAYEYEKPVVTWRHYTEGTIVSSLWNSMVSAGVSPRLAMKMSDLYAWQIDFFDVKKGDSFRLMYDVAYVDDTTVVDIRSVEGAVFTHQGKEYYAIPFCQDSVREYFDEKGNSLRKTFLKAPLDFFRITSRFTNARYHPILKRYRPHHGVDYAAPAGTPVKTIGDGVVVEKSYQRGGAGNYLKIKHNGTYTTTYMHLSRFAKGIAKGHHVKQGEVIGYVGSTGLSTGPHLDFRVYMNNQPVNPLTIESPPCLPVKPELKDTFLLVRKEVLTQLDSLRLKSGILVEQPDTLSADISKS